MGWALLYPLYLVLLALALPAWGGAGLHGTGIGADGSAGAAYAGAGAGAETCASNSHGPTISAAPALTAIPVVLVVGDSLSAEYGLARDSGWVRLLAQRLDQAPLRYRVVNASISGDTTSGGRVRLPALLEQYRPVVVLIELGANDGLRGLSIEAMHANLQAMIDAVHQARGRALLIGMHVPPNYGAVYEKQFYGVFVTLAQRNRVALAPFLLDGFAEQLDLFQADHIHPLAQAQARMLDNVWPYLLPLLQAPALPR